MINFLTVVGAICIIFLTIVDFIWVCNAMQNQIDR